MSFSVFIGLAALLFIAGILFIIKGVSSEEQKIVPIVNPKELAEFKNAYVPQPVTVAPIISEKLFSTPVAPPEKEPSAAELDKQRRLDRLEDENKLLRTEISGHKEKLGMVKENVEALKQEYDKVKTAQSDKIHAFEEKITRMQMEKEQLMENHRLIDELRAKGELFEKQHAENLSLQAEMKAFIQKLEQEKEDLLNIQAGQVDQSDMNALGNRLAGSIEIVESLKGENIQLRRSQEDLQSAFQERDEQNRQLLEKEKKIQFELAKNRAQVLGLEKICEDFKRQIESMSAMAQR